MTTTGYSADPPKPATIGVGHIIKNYWKRIPFLMLYYCIGRWLPASTTFIFGKPSKLFRRFLCRHIFDYCGKNVNIERNVLFGSGFRIRIGDNSGMGINCVVCSDIEIGNDVLMGPGCFFLTFNHSFRDKSRTVKSQGYQYRKKTVIGNDVWIGRESMFTPGRRIADGTVIAARTLVCKDFEPYSVIGGNPSRKIGERE